jgi:hypothetical protein
MGWDRSAPADPKYRTKAHRDLLAGYKRRIQREGYVVCAAVDCLLESRYITNPRGMERDGVTVGHQDDGVGIRGPEHRACNLTDAARRARARQSGPVHARRWAL